MTVLHAQAAPLLPGYPRRGTGETWQWWIFYDRHGEINLGETRARIPCDDGMLCAAPAERMPRFTKRDGTEEGAGLPRLAGHQPTRTHVHGPLTSNAYAEDTSTVSAPSKLLLSAMLVVSVLFSVAK
jgi:hypothetical protein